MGTITEQLYFNRVKYTKMSDIPTAAKVLLKDCEPLEIGDTTEVKETARPRLVYGIAASSTFSKPGLRKGSKGTNTQLKVGKC